MELPVANRKAAGQALAEALRAYRDRDDVIVLGLPRGGVPVAMEVAIALGVPLDLILVRKLGTPGQEELAMGAIASGDSRVINEDVVQALAISPQVIEQVAAEERNELKRREQAYRGDRPWPKLADKCVILVDDGLATGATMRAAVGAVRAQLPAHIFHLSGSDQLIQHAFSRQSLHLDQPVDGFALAIQVKLARRIYCQGNYTEVNILRQTPIQAHLFQAIMVAALQGAEVQELEAYRFFQFVDKAIGQENPGHMGLNNVYLGRMPGIGRRLEKKGNLGRDVDVGSVVFGKCHNDEDLSCCAVMLSVDRNKNVLSASGTDA